MQNAFYHRTFHTRLVGDFPGLDAWADLFAVAERQVAARLASGEDLREIARTGYGGLGLNAKQFEHAMISVRGKLDSASELAKVHVGEIEAELKAKTKTIKQREKDEKDASKAIAKAIRTLSTQDRKIRGAKSEIVLLEAMILRLAALDDLAAAKMKRKAVRAALHQHRRRIGILESRLTRAKKAIQKPSICFGTKKLFKAQHHLEKNRLGSHEDWLKGWRSARGGNILVVGDALYSSGNSFVKLRETGDGTFAIEFRLPSGLKHLADRALRISGNDIYIVTIKDLRFAHGADVIRKALVNRQPLTWRFVKDSTSWTAHVTVEDRHIVEIFDFREGCLAVDINIDHLAVTLVSADGNPLHSSSIPCMTYGASTNRAKNIVRHAVLQVVTLAKALGVPIACEKLDFSAKRAVLEEETCAKRARMLSSFAYGAILGGLKSCAIRHGVAVRAVNPAFTSLIGRLKFARRYGLSVHAAAALAIGRRAMDLSERPPSVDHVDEGLRVTLRRPEDRRRHVWRTWGRIARETAALAARGRAGLRAGSIGVEGMAQAGTRSRLTGASPSSVEGRDSPRVKTRPTAWPASVGGSPPAVDWNGGSTAYSG